MMEYETFKETVLEKLKDYLPDEYKDCEFELRKVEKINRTLDGLSMIRKVDGLSVNPTLYMETMYAQYLDTKDLDKTLRLTAQLYVKSADNEKVKSLANLDGAKDKVIFVLVNTEQNKEMLKNMPHREFNDLSVVYKVLLENDNEGIMTVPVDNAISEKLGLSEEKLYDLAFENTKRLLPTTVKSMEQVMRELMSGEGFSPTDMDEMLIDLRYGIPLVVISNNKGLFGAANLLYTDVLGDLAEKLDDDLYIMPSSISEVLAVKSEGMDPEVLAQMVTEVNMNDVVIGDRLSNQVYFYDRSLNRVTLATDTPNKSLENVPVEREITSEINRLR